jgi:hypothetical protein
MAKKIIVIVTLFFGLIGYSQENTASPYSFYGLGDVKFKGTQDARSMGGLSFATDSISLNLLNPASYAGLKLVTFGVAGTTTFTKLNNATTSENAKRTSFDYLAIGLPLGNKFGVSFGILPYSAVGYKIINFQTVGSEERASVFTGQGNINRTYLGFGYNVSKNFSLGVDVQYNFGIIENESIESIAGVQLSSRERNNSNINGVSFNIGGLYNNKISEKLNVSSSFTFSPEARLNSENLRNLATINFNSNGSENVIALPKDVPVKDTKLIIPTKLSFGAGIGETNKWLVGTEITFKGSERQNNRFEDVNTNHSFENGEKYAIGGYFIPKYDSFSSYLSTVVYRMGFTYEKTGLIIENQSINDYGMNFGLGFPLGLSKLNVGVEFGKRGTTKNNLIEENYFNLSVGLSLSDKWFRKRKID